MILVKLCQLGGLLHCIVKTSQLVNQLYLDSIGSQPYTALTNLINLFGLHAATFSNNIQESLITTVNVGLHLRHNIIGFLTHNQLGLVSGKLIGLHTIKGYAQLIGNQSAEVWNQAEDTNTTSNSCWLGNDIIGRRTDPVTTRCSSTTHRYHYRFLSLYKFNSMTNLLRCHSTTATRVHTEHNSLHIVIIGQLAQILCCCLTNNTVSTTVKHIHSLIVNDASICIIDSNLIALLLLLRLDIQHIRERQLLNIIVFIQLQARFDFILNLLGEQHLVYQLCFHIVLSSSKCQQAVVYQLVKCIGLYLATFGHLLQPVVPYTIHVCLTLFAVVFAHTCKGVAFYITLIFTNLGHHVFDTKLVVESFVILAFATKTAQVNRALTVNKNLIGNGSHIIRSLSVIAGIAHNPLAALLEILQSVAQLLSCSRTIKSSTTTLDVYTFDILLVLSLTNAGYKIIQSHRARIS